MSFERNVFINCPFDDDYYPILKSILFTLTYLDFDPLISETTDSGSARFDKIVGLVQNAQYSIHDLSRIQLNAKKLPRFNMPFECGIDFGIKASGLPGMDKKICLILEKEPYRYKEFISDISGNDIRAHNNEPEEVIKCVRDWFKTNGQVRVAYANQIWLVYNEFLYDFNDIMTRIKCDPNKIGEITFADIIEIMQDWVHSYKNRGK